MVGRRDGREVEGREERGRREVGGRRGKDDNPFRHTSQHSLPSAVLGLAQW